MPSSPLLTVSIVTFRSDLAALKETLESLAACRLPATIVILDNTPEERYFQTLTQTTSHRCIRSPRNGGYGYGHNVALRSLPHAPYHLVLNPDVAIHPGCIETLVDFMEQEKDVVLAVPKVLSPDGRLQALNKRDPNLLDLALRRFLPDTLQRIPFVKERMARYVMMDYGYDRHYEVPYASGCFMLFRRDALDAIKGFDERFFMYFEDADITRRIRAHGRVQYVPNASITHRWTRASYHDATLMLSHMISAVRYFQTWGWRWW